MCVCVCVRACVCVHACMYHHDACKATYILCMYIYVAMHVHYTVVTWARGICLIYKHNVPGHAEPKGKSACDISAMQILSVHATTLCDTLL